jgi:hypothetical protein
MPLPAYGVAIGTPRAFTRDPTHEPGHWYRGHLTLDTPEGVYRAALVADAPPEVGISYRVVDDLTIVDIPVAHALGDGFHHLASAPSSGALDYARSPVLRNRVWFEGLRWLTADAYRSVRRPEPGRPVYGPDLADRLAGAVLTTRAVAVQWWPDLQRPGTRTLLYPWVESDGRNALDALGGLIDGACRVYVYGQRFAAGLGVHDVHLNQGDPAGGPWHETDGPWQDGAVMCEHPAGQVAVWQVKFNTQSLHTDDGGHPR